MPHITFGNNRFCGGDGAASTSWSSAIIPAPSRFFLRNSRISPTKKKSSPLKGIPSPRRKDHIDKESFLSTLGLYSTKSSDSNQFMELEKTLTRSPLRSQICRESFSKNGTLRNVVDVAFSSHLGQLINRHLTGPTSFGTNAVPVDSAANKYERFCDGMFVSSDERMLRLRTRVQNPYPISFNNKRQNPSTSTHVYCFTRKQRKEHLLTLKTGLDKRSRLLKSLCKPATVRLERLKITKDMWIPPSKTPAELLLLTNKSNKAATTRTRTSENVCKPEISLSVQKPKTPPVNFLKSPPRKPRCSLGKPVQRTLNEFYTPMNRHVEVPSLPDSNLTGKEIVLDGKIVIDLCSDDESDDVVTTKNNYSPTRDARSEMVGQKNSLSDSINNNLRNKFALRTSTGACNLGNRGPRFSPCVDMSRSVVRVDDLSSPGAQNAYLRDYLVPAKPPSQSASVQCKVEVQDITKKLSLAADGRLYVQNTHVTVEGMPLTSRPQRANGKVIQTRSISKNGTIDRRCSTTGTIHNNQRRRPSSELSSRRTASEGDETDCSNNIDDNDEDEDDVEAAREDRAPASLKRLKNWSGLTKRRRSISSQKRRNFVSGKEKCVKPNATPVRPSSKNHLTLPEIFTRYFGTSHRSQSSLSLLQRGRSSLSLQNERPMEVAFKCHICGLKKTLNGLFGPSCAEKSVTHHMLDHHNGSEVVFIFNTVKPGHTLIEVKLDQSPSPKRLKLSPSNV